MPSRNILCQKCAARHIPAGTRQIYAANDLEPAEYQRLTLGAALQPKQSQRYMIVNGVGTLLDAAYYNCDTCYAEIRPTEPCGTWTIWSDPEIEPALWEKEFLEVRP